ncbi:amidoligase family protein [Pseudokordiimonas caeni]|uniref:amidoligase family protein n=1 Tax=Pseudokordiimonas caeni TaxID=2997908 RepID=UPI0028112824|nr:amidoligase family protein [Pseudokordiimonas caeni]
MTKPQMPPIETTAGSDARRVGVEIEFAGLAPGDAAGVVQDCFGGSLSQVDLYHWKVAGSALGDFNVKLDTQYVEKGSSELQRMIEKADEDLGVRLRQFVGQLSENLVPTEVVGPPIAMADIGEMDRLCNQLHKAGAKDGHRNPLHAFGLHLNPEVSGTEVGDILPTLQAYLFLSPWLREKVGLDLSRRLLPFIDPFPDEYGSLVVRADYEPSMEELICDYLDHNDTRNRELDLLPLFAHIDRDLVSSRIDDPRIKSRPTFHYRLPEARLESEDWSVAIEWNRWVLVERLAADDKAMADLLAMGDYPKAPEEIANFIGTVTGTGLAPTR